jgi:hypothetical protein
LGQTSASGSDRFFDSRDNVEGNDKGTIQAPFDKTSRGPSTNVDSSSTLYPSRVSSQNRTDIGLDLGAALDREGYELVGGWFDADNLPRIARDHL